MPLNAQVAVSIVAHETAAGDLSRQMRVTPATYAMLLTDGAGANQAQVVWSDSRTATTSNDDLVVTALPDTRDGAAVTVAFSAVKVVYVRNKSSSQGLVLGLVGVNSFTAFPSTGGGATIRPGGCYLVTAPSGEGFVVSAGNIARLRADAGSVDYDIVLIGEGTVT